LKEIAASRDTLRSKKRLSKNDEANLAIANSASKSFEKCQSIDKNTSRSILMASLSVRCRHKRTLATVANSRNGSLWSRQSYAVGIATSVGQPVRELFTARAGARRQQDTMGEKSMKPETTAIVLIEYQNDFTTSGGVFHDGVKDVMQSNNMLANTVKVANKGRAAGATTSECFHVR
jgi:hypothetical protein